jgi:hypothetical protein
MNRAGSRIAIVTAAVALSATSLGCGFLSQAKQTVENVAAISDLADKLGKSDGLTFTAEYALDDKSVATVVQQPPKAAFIGKQGRFILTEESLLMCTGTGSKTACQRSPNTTQASSSADQAAMMSAIAGGGFINTPMALALMTAAAVIPGTNVDKSERTIAGLNSTCLKVTGIPDDGDPNSVQAKDFTVCVADNGVLTHFTGTGTDNVKLGVELSKFSTTVNASAFAVPAGTKIVDVGEIQPPN